MSFSVGRGLLIAVLGLFLSVSAFAPSRAEPAYPALSGRVVDAANVLPPATEQALTTRLADLETRTGRQLVVATVPSLGDREIEEYATGLFRAWGLGQRARNDGVLLVVAPTERRVRVEVGYGLEGVLTDALSGRIIQNSVIPRFRAGDMPGGVTAGADALIAQLSADPQDARAAVNAAEANKTTRSGSIWPIIFTIIAIWLVIAILRGVFGRRRGGGWLGPAIVFGSGLGRGGGSWGGGGGWSGGGGGGFSGGGGSSGGGGASGGW